MKLVLLFLELLRAPYTHSSLLYSLKLLHQDCVIDLKSIETFIAF